MVSKKIVFSLLLFAFFANGLESRKPYSRPKEELPTLTRKTSQKLGCFKTLINFLSKKVYGEPYYLEETLGKLILENWEPRSNGEELLRHEVLPFVRHKDKDNVRSKLRCTCKYLKELIDEEWGSALKDLSSKDVKEILRDAVRFGHKGLVKALCEHDKLGAAITDSENKYECDFLSGNQDRQQIIEEEKEVVRKEALELANIFELAVKKGDEEIIKLLLESEPIREALTYAYPYVFFSDADYRDSASEDFFKKSGNNYLVSFFVKDNWVMWITCSDKGHIEFFEIVFDDNGVKAMHDEYCQKIEALEKRYPGEIIKRKIISTLNDDNVGLSFAYGISYFDMDSFMTKKDVRAVALSGDNRFVMATRVEEHKKITYMACSAEDEFLSATKLFEYAAERDCVHAVKLLLQKKYYLGITEQNKQRALFLALASGATRVLPLLGVPKDVDTLALLESFLEKKETYHITDQDIARVFLVGFRTENKDVSDKLLSSFKDAIFSYILKKEMNMNYLFEYACDLKRFNIAQMLLDDERTFKKIKIRKNWDLTGDDELDAFFMKNKERLGLTTQNAQYALEVAVGRLKMQSVKLLLEHFDYSEEQLQAAFEKANSVEIRDIIKSKMNQ